MLQMDWNCALITDGLDCAIESSLNNSGSARLINDSEVRHIGARIELGVGAVLRFDRTFQHPLAQRGLIEMLPAEWVARLGAKKDGTERTDLGYWQGEDLVGMEGLWRDILKKGMRDPLIIGVGRVCRSTRLEAGNHRICIFREKGIAYVPAVVLVGDSSVTSEENVTHRFQRDLLIDEGWPDFGPYPEKVYMRPSDVFVEFNGAALPRCAGAPNNHYS